MIRRTSLLPDHCRRRNANLRHARFWAGVVAIVGLLLTAASLILAEQQGALARQAVETARQASPIQQALGNIAQLNRQTLAIQKRAQASQAIEQRDSCLAIVQATVESCRMLGGRVRLTTIRMDDATSIATKSNGDRSKLVATGRKDAAGEHLRAPEKQVLLTGSTAADEDISALMLQLQAAGTFRDVSLESAQATTEHGSERRSFQIRCRH